MADKHLTLFDAHNPIVGQRVQMVVNHSCQDIRQGNACQLLQLLHTGFTFMHLVVFAVDFDLNFVMVVLMFMPVALFSRALVRFWRVFMLVHKFKPRLLRTVLAGSSAGLANMVLYNEPVK